MIARMCGGAVCVHGYACVCMRYCKFVYDWVRKYVHVLTSKCARLWVLVCRNMFLCALNLVCVRMGCLCACAFSCRLLCICERVTHLCVAFVFKVCRHV